MKRIHIVGRKNHGKTALIVDLLREYSRRGVRVGCIKHSPHRHELDAPGKDSHRHRTAGAQPAAIITPDLLGIYVAPGGADPYGLMASLFAGCDLVLVEGDVEASAPKVEVWRQAVGGDCLANARGDILAVISDDHAEVRVPVLARRDVETLSHRILEMARPEIGTRRPP
jgi:molybdopterin-guanine dinucleotide biosynthesis protein B